MKNIIFVFTFAISLLTANYTFSQWTTNTSVNTLICDTTSEQTLSKIGITSDGGCYIGWFDQRNGSYAVYLQKLDARGIKQFSQSGLLISNKPQASSISDWDLQVDDSDCCVLVFSDLRSGPKANPFAYRISPSGQFLWGANGIALTDSINALYQKSPKIIVTSDGNYIITWNYDLKIALTKLNKAGTKVWGNTPLMIIGNTANNESLWFPSGVKSDNGSVILYWIGFSGSSGNPVDYRNYTQKFASDGTKLWGNPQDTIWNLGQAPGTYLPHVYSDGNGGAIYAWTSFLDGPTGSYVQRKNSAGQIQFPVNGVKVCTGSVFSLIPSVTYNPSTQETFVFWKQMDLAQGTSGVFGQKFNATGNKLWGDNGKEFKRLDTNTVSSISSCLGDTSIMVYYLENLWRTNSTLVRAFKINGSGDMFWGNTSNHHILTPGSAVKTKMDLVTGINQNKMTILSFTDSRADTKGVYAQNINYDGSFGPTTGIVNLGTQMPNKYSLKQNYPNPFNPSTKIQFQVPKNDYVSLKIYNALGKEVAALVNENLSAGNYEINWNAENYSTGIYFYKLTSGSFSEVKKMVLIK